MLNKRFLLIVTLLSMMFILAIPAIQASQPAGSGTVVVRVFLDADNNAHDNGDGGLAGWTVSLNGTPVGTTGRNGYTSISTANVGDRVSITPPSNGWRLARSGPGLENANGDSGSGTSGIYRQPNGKKIFLVGPAYTLQSGDFVTRNNGSDSAWLRFSVIRVQRILVTDAPNGAIFEFFHGNQFVGSDNAGPNGFATFVAGGLFYGSDIVVVQQGTDCQSAPITIPYGYQPNVSYNDFVGAGCS